jgi:predicted lipid-binding transport protein (Tim44 family)
MGDFFDLPTIIVIALAVVILVRLRSVLGTRTGNERPPMGRIRSSSEPAETPENDDTVVPLRTRRAEDTAPAFDDDQRSRKLDAEIERLVGETGGIAAGLRAIAGADPNFMPKSFLDGAKAAYEMIVTAFATGDRRTLKNLLEKDVYESFEQAIADRESAGQRTEFTFVGLPGIKITEAELDKRVAQVTLQFDAEVISATYDKEGQLAEGNAEQVINISDEWTFARTARSRDPNWKLVATNQLS